MKRRWIWIVLLVLVCGLRMQAETWFVRADGGSRYTASTKAGQCDGKGDAAYPGKGLNRHCAFNDYRSLYDNGTYGKLQWVIAGGDTVILDNTKQWRVGFDQNGANDPWCPGGNANPFGCTNPAIPAGTAGQHTRILGRNAGSCSTDVPGIGHQPDPGKLTQIFGGHAVGVVLGLGDTAYVDVECLEITSHSTCIAHGSPANPPTCNRGYPVDDFDAEGIATNTGTHDILLQDLWIHGHTDRGIIGPIGGVVTANRVHLSTNGLAGWDFDNGSGQASVHATLNLTHSLIEFSGCNQRWPSPLPISCYGQSSGGYGDGIGTPAGMGMDVTIDHSVFRYNTQDGEDFGHIDSGMHSLRITNSLSYGNGGGQFKWGPNFTSVFFANNLVLGNCMRMSAPLPGIAGSYNAHLEDFCRAYDGISFNFRQGGSVMFVNNTIVSYSPTTLDVSCWDASCSNSTLVFENNIVLGYDNPNTYRLGGKSGGPGGFYFDKPVGKVVRANNVYSGLRNMRCVAHEVCEDPKFAGEPRFTKEQDLDGFNFHLSSASPARRAGMRVDGVPVDYEGKARPGAGNYDAGAMQE